MPSNLHTFLVSLALRAVRLLPRPLHGALDAWSRRIARQRALRRQRAAKPKG